MNILEYENYQEKKSHGPENFPYTTYLCSIPLDFSVVPTHWHDEMEIIYIKKGQGIVTIDFTTYCVYAGCIVFILPGQVHAIEQKDTCSMEYENILFRPEILLAKKSDVCNTAYFQPLLAGVLRIPSLFLPDSPFYEQIAACIDGADEICKHFPSGYELAIKGQLFLLFFTLFSKCATTATAPKENKSIEKVKQIVKYIEHNYMEKITITDIADELHLSESHFMKFFKNTMGTTFIDYLNEYRLTMASRLLASSDSSILDIATEVGFDNLSYFNRLFKRRFHMTPREYRKRQA